MSRHVENAPVEDVQTETGSMRVSSPEVTAFDLVRFPAAAGHLSNVATVLGELAEKIDAVALAGIAPRYSVPDGQRLGFLLELMGKRDLAEPLLRTLEHRRRRPIRLAPDESAQGEQPDPRWRVIPNARVEADL